MEQTALAPERDDEPVPESGTLVGLLYVLRKAHRELDGEDIASQRFREISTRGDARRYIGELMPRLAAEREKRRQHRRDIDKKK